jgi:hypothetical protein
MPPLHWLPAAHRLPQVPQLRGSVCVFVQRPLHMLSPPPHTHAPPEQVDPEEHTKLHFPQSSGLVEVSTHAPVQSVRPAAHMFVHIPCEHTKPGLHTLPQVPQLLGSFASCVQTPEHMLPPFGQAHFPLWHVVWALQTRPQPPQLLSSVCSFTHEAPHCVCPPEHDSVQVPLEQTSFGPQAFPHWPQLSELVCVSVHAPLQTCSLPGHWHLELTQVVLPVQTSPQPPQLLGSFVSLTQAPPQRESPAAQVDRQKPTEQAAPAAHARPQAPQLFGSDARSTQATPQRKGRAPAVQTHVPIEHWDPLAVQLVLQLPQKVLLLWRSKQPPLQSVRPGAQPVSTHMPSEQTPAPQLMPQPPQLVGSLSGLTHTPSQSIPIHPTGESSCVVSAESPASSEVPVSSPASPPAPLVR